mgnify:CR=1 FL=1
MTTLYLCHPASLDHDTPPGHPERADRIRVIERALEDERFAALVREQAPLELLRVDSAAGLVKATGLKLE